jgi:hypothetical protein
MLKVVGGETAAQDEVEGRSLLDEIVHEGARRMLVAALEAEVAAYVDAHRAERDQDGHALVRAQELIEEIGARAFEPEVHECRARLARVRGDSGAADGEIEEARRLYAAMGATAQVERLLNEVTA